jgi:hypothetical protein
MSEWKYELAKAAGTITAFMVVFGVFAILSHFGIIEKVFNWIFP